MMHMDHHQDIARSTYADMLNDDERNKIFDEAIRISVSSLVKSPIHNPTGDRQFECGDIGTGSGLLSMMIVRAFQQMSYDNFHVFAFETFKPMARCARQVIELNGMSRFITIIPEHSDETTYDYQFDLLVAELLDTELIGENCLSTYRRAIENLCSPTCLFVPHQARIYVEPVASSRLFSRHAFGDMTYDFEERGRLTIDIVGTQRDCCGLPEIDDMQVSMLRVNQEFVRICDPLEVFSFTFNDHHSLKLEDCKKLEFVLKRDIDQPPVVILWWDIIMFNNDSLTNIDPIADFQILSCAPVWARDDALLKRDANIRAIYGRDVWREHWIQGVYYFQSVKETRDLVGTKAGSKLIIHAYHDSCSLWFDLKRQHSRYPPSCTCGVHRHLSRSEFAFLNDMQQISKLLKPVLSDLKSPIKAVLEYPPQNYEEDHLQSDVMRTSGIRKSKPKWRIALYGHGDERKRLIYDPCVVQPSPWLDYLFEYFTSERLLLHSVEKFVIKCTQVQFDNLNRICQKVGHCEGFNLEPVDKLITKSISVVDSKFEPHHLWEYPCKRLDSDTVIFRSDCVDNPRETLEKIYRNTYWVHIPLVVESRPGNWKSGWALVVWLELTLKGSNEILSTGPKEACSIGEKMDWNIHCKQMVHFLHDYPTIPAPGSVIDVDIGIWPPMYLTIQRAIEYRQLP